MLNHKKHIFSARRAAIGIITAAAILSSSSTWAQDSTESKSYAKAFGVKAGYITRNQSVVAGLFFQYQFSDHFRMAPDVEAVFSRRNQDAFLVNIDCHFPFEMSANGKCALYPIAGLNYSSWNRRLSPEDVINDKDTSQKSTNFGLNLGAGYDMVLTSTLKLNIEARYTLVKSNSNLQVTAGIAYLF
jgi:outer membrane protein X